MSRLKDILTYCLYFLGRKSSKDAPRSQPIRETQPEKPMKGTNGPLLAEMLVMQKDGRLTMVVDHEFEDVPEYVEWDVSRNIIGIVQMGGAVAELKSVLPAEKVDMFRNAKNLALAIRFEGKHVVHGVYLVIRE